MNHNMPSEFLFENLGATFVRPLAYIQQHWQQIQALVLDWDGVFNAGAKTADKGSPYQEADSAGTNLLRFGKWLQTNTQIKIAIITGADNPTAFQLAQREHFHAVYHKIVEKSLALEHFCLTFGLQYQQVACFFDDAIDLSMVQHTPLNFLVRRKASPLFEKFVQQRQLCAYITAHEGGDNAIREICELLLMITQNYEQVLEERMLFSPKYQTYLTERNQALTQFYTQKEISIIPTHLHVTPIANTSVSH